MFILYFGEDTSECESTLESRLTEYSLISNSDYFSCAKAHVISQLIPGLLLSSPLRQAIIILAVLHTSLAIHLL